MTEQVQLWKKVLSNNDLLAEQLRYQFNDCRVCVLNFISSPGSGKTSLLEHTIRHFRVKLKMAVITGDVETENDTERLKAAGGPVVRPIVTGGACHLDARMIQKSLVKLVLDELDLLIIENVGNLVCPAAYDLGEDSKIVLVSTTEGDDKPLKYPAIFRRASMMVVNKIDLLGMSDFSLERVIHNVRNINGNIEICSLSCRTGVGLDDWYAWLQRQLRSKREIEPGKGVRMKP
ncbi:MAG: hydrogenase nickel incorporation protein HypB [Candidatus Zixiibacteriota bacterium]